MLNTNTSWELANRILNDMTEKQTINTCYIWGPPGIGKTWGAIETSPDPFVITLTEETPASELRGFYMPRGGDFIWVDGPVTTGMREGRRVVFNEISHAGPDVQSFMFPILEGKGTCRFTLPTGETVVAAPGFNVVGTDNVSHQELPEALRNRWNVKLHITTYSPGGLAGLTTQWRRLASNSEIAHDDNRWISLRDWYSLEALYEASYTLEECCHMVFGVEAYPPIYSSIKASFVQKEQIEADKEYEKLFGKSATIEGSE